MSRLLILLLVILFLPISSVRAESDVPPGLDKPWDENESREFPPEFLGWWDRYSDNPPQGIQILPNGTIQSMDKNPINRGTARYRVIRVMPPNIYLVWAEDYGQGMTYVYAWLHFEIPDYAPNFFHMEVLKASSLSKEEFENLSDSALWNKFSQEGEMGWSSETYARDLVPTRLNK